MGIDWSTLGSRSWGSAWAEFFRSIAENRRQRELNETLGSLLDLYNNPPLEPEDPKAGETFVDIILDPKQEINNRIKDIYDRLPDEDKGRYLPSLIRMQTDLFGRVDSRKSAKEILNVLKGIAKQDPTLQRMLDPYLQIIDENKPETSAEFIDSMFKTAISYMNAPLESKKKLERELDLMQTDTWKEIKEINKQQALDIYREKKEIEEQFRKEREKDKQAKEGEKALYEAWKKKFETSRSLTETFEKKFQQIQRELNNLATDEDTIARLKEAFTKKFMIATARIGKGKTSEVEVSGDELVRTVAQAAKLEGNPNHLSSRELDIALKELVRKKQGLESIGDVKDAIAPESINEVMEFIKENLGDPENLERAMNALRYIQKEMMLLQARDLLIKNKREFFKNAMTLYKLGDPEAESIITGYDWTPFDLDRATVNKDTGELIVPIDPNALQDRFGTPTGTFGFIEGIEALPENITRREKVTKKTRSFFGKKIEIPEEEPEDPERGKRFLKNLQKSATTAQPVEGFLGIAKAVYEKAKPFIERDIDRTLTLLEETKPTYFRYIDKEGNERQVVPRDINEFLIHLENKIEADLKRERGIDIDVDLTSEPLKDLQERIIEFWKRFVNE